MMEKRKKILFLDANKTVIEAINYAKQCGYYTITCDNKPSNPGHTLSDKQYYISTYDTDKIYGMFEDERIDGVVYFSSLHGLYAACRLIEKYSLPGFPLNKEEVLSDKYKFRNFLTKHGFKTPSYVSVSSIHDLDKNKEKIIQMKFPLIIKPVDGGGNRGISKINDYDELERSVEYALSESIVKNVIIEEFIESNLQINGDCLFVNGKLIFAFLGKYLYPVNNSMISYATIFGKEVLPQIIRKKAETEIQRIIKKSNLTSGIINIEIRVDSNGDIYFIEINPRHSGNRIYSLMNKFINIPMEHIAVNVALNNLEFVNKIQINEDQYSAFCVLYSDSEGFLDSVDISEKLNKYIITKEIFKQKGDKINKYTLLRDRVGLIHLMFPTKIEMDNIFYNIKNLYTIKLAK